MMQPWQLQDAKSRFSEIVDLAMTNGPQLVTRRGQEAVVIMSAKEFRQMSGRTPTLLNTLLNAPRGEPLKIIRSREHVRKIAL